MAEMVTVLRVQQAQAAIGSTDSDQHPTARNQRWHDGTIGLKVRRRARLVAPKANLVENTSQQAPAANAPKRIRMHTDDGVVPQPNLVRRNRDNLAP